MRTKLVVFICTLVFISYYAIERKNVASAQHLQPAGWVDVNSLLSGEFFADYVSDVRQMLIDHRIPVDPARSSQEIDMATPKQFDPAESCQGNTHGIVILVHGLSDTAFAMQDLALYFFSQCYIARTTLLPGHGTRPGDMLVVGHQDWLRSIRYLSQQASKEHDRVLLVGFSLGAVVTLSVAMEEDNAVDAVIAISPAYHISSYEYARFAPWIHQFYRWIDTDLPDDPMRYEAMPTRGIAETVRAMNLMKNQIDDNKTFGRPWMLIQSMDDTTISPLENTAFVLEKAGDSRSKILNFYSDQIPGDDEPMIQWLSGTSDTYNVTGLSHLAVHVSPENSHYGFAGDYRHCGGADGREALGVELCVNAQTVQFSDWNKLSLLGDTPAALSSFNPEFPLLVDSITQFISQLD